MENWERILAAVHDSEELVKRTGGLPEIWQAAEDLRYALDRTDQEISEAVIADRFPRTASDNMMVIIENCGLTPEALRTIEEEGEAGYKRITLAVRSRNLRQQLMGLIGQLVELRCDLVFSQTD